MKIQKTNNTKNVRYNLAVIGASKTGKTSLIGTLPGKVLICNADKGMNSLKSKNLEYVAVNSWTDVVEFMQFITNPTQMKKFGYDWVSFDSVSIIAKYLKDYLKEKGLKGFDFWGEYQELLGSLLQTTRDTELFNSLCIFEEIEKENDNGLLVKRFGIEGSLASKVPYFFDAAFATKKIIKKDKPTQYVLQFTDKTGYNGLGGRAEFKEYEPANISHIIKKLKAV